MLTFTLSVEDANTILNALAGQPYASVAGVIQRMQEQAQSQIQEVDDSVEVAE